MPLTTLGYRLCAPLRLYGRIRNWRKVGKTLPIASFTRSPASGASPLLVTVDASASYAPDAKFATLTYDWNWGDASGHGSGVTTTHSYTGAGTYTITLTVTDTHGNTAVTTLTVVAS